MKTLGTIAIVLALLLSAFLIVLRSDVRSRYIKEGREISTEQQMEDAMALDKNEYITTKEIRLWLLIGGGVLFAAGYISAHSRKT